MASAFYASTFLARQYLREGKMQAQSVRANKAPLSVPSVCLNRGKYLLASSVVSVPTVSLKLQCISLQLLARQLTLVATVYLFVAGHVKNFRILSLLPNPLKEYLEIYFLFKGASVTY